MALVEKFGGDDLLTGVDFKVREIEVNRSKVDGREIDELFAHSRVEKAVLLEVFDLTHT